MCGGDLADRRNRDLSTQRVPLVARRQPLGHNLFSALVAYWPLCEQAGDRLDILGGRHLTDNGTVTGADGVGSLASQFLAANGEYLSRPSEGVLETGNTAWALSAWAWLGTKANRIVASKFNNAVGGLEYILMYRTAEDRFALLIYNGSSLIVMVVATGAGATSVSTWYHIVAGYDPSSTTAYITVNGVTNTGVAGSSPFTTNTAFIIGSDARGAAGLLWNGRIQRVGLWKRVLTQAEREYLYNGGRGRDYPFL